MKSIIGLVILAILGCGSDSPSIPRPVKKSFKRKYPFAADPVWHVDNEQYNVVFNNQYTQCTAVFSLDRWSHTHTTYDLARLEPCLQRYLDRRHPEAAIVRASRWDSPEDSTYEVVVALSAADANLAIHDTTLPLDGEEDNPVRYTLLKFNKDCKYTGMEDQPALPE